MLILGAGYVGKALRAAVPGSVATHRPGTPLGRGELPFALDDEPTWAALPTAQADVIWTFPAAPLEQVQRFFERKLQSVRLLVVLGSTSAYQVGGPDEIVTEATPLDLTQPRVQGEEWLRQQGAVILRLAGIHGPGREPLGWLKRGLIKNGLKRVNLIHVDDIVAAIAAVQQRPLRGEQVNLADGAAATWDELVARLRARGDLPSEFTLPQHDPGSASKRVANGRLSALLPGYPFREP